MKRVASFQSRVLDGMVGNNVALEVFSAMHIPFVLIDSVMYSHVATKRLWEYVFDTKEHLSYYRGLLQGIEASGPYVLQTGYFGSWTQLGFLMLLLDDTIISPSMLVVDPVLGANGRLYVPEDVADTMPLFLERADIMTPNQFELEELTQRTISSEDDIVIAMERGLSLFPRMQAVVLTSSSCGDPRFINAYLAVRGQQIEKISGLLRCSESLPGCGDVFCATLCAKLVSGVPVRDAVIYAYVVSWFVLVHSLRDQLSQLDLRAHIGEALWWGNDDRSRSRIQTTVLKDLFTE